MVGKSLQGEIYDGSRSRVLFLSEDMLWPPIGGGRIRCIKLLTYALERIEVDLVVVAPEPDVIRDRSAIPDLPGLTTHVFVDEARSRFVPARRSADATALAGQLAQEHGGYDAVHLEGHFLWPVVPTTLRSRTVVVEQNIESDVLSQRLALGEAIALDDLERLRTCEQYVWRHAGALVTLTPEDTAEIRRREPAVAPHTIPNGWDHLPARPAPRPDDGGRLTSPRLLFFGDYDFVANRHALHWLLTDIFPRIRDRISNATLALGGINMSRDLRDAARRRPGVQTLGFIDDVVSELDRADIVLCPLTWGGGVKVKMIEALRRCCLVVSTTPGAQGIPEPLRSTLCIADDAQLFAQHVFRLCADPHERLRRRRLLVGAQDVTPTWEDSMMRTMRVWSDVSRRADESQSLLPEA